MLLFSICIIMGILVSWHQPKAMKAKNSVRFFSSWMHRDGWRFKRYNDEKYWPSLNLLHARTKCEFQLIWKRGENRIGSKIATSIEEAKKFETNRKSRIKWTKEPENNNKCNKKNEISYLFLSWFFPPKILSVESLMYCCFCYTT